MAFGDANSPTELVRTLQAIASDVSLTVNPARGYTLMHLGHTSAGVAALGAIYFAFDAATTVADYGPDANKAILYGADGGGGVVGAINQIVLPPGITTITYQGSAADIMFQIVSGPWTFGEGW